MKRFYLILLALAMLIAIPAVALANGGTEAEADLDGSQEVPAVTTDMTGEVEVEIDDGVLEFELEVSNNTNDIFARR